MQQRRADRVLVLPVKTAGLVPWIVVMAAVLLAGCGGDGTGSSGASSPSSPDAVHEAWVAAVRDGDLAGAEALADPTLPDPAAFARDAVARMQDYMTNAASPTGPLQEVTVEPVADDVGRSVWQFAQKRWCYRAELVSRDAQWFVSRWGQTSVDCP